jgi:predicted nucleic acid-binding protein
LAQVIAPTIVVPRAVAEELEVKGQDDVAVQALRETPWLRIVEPVPPPPETRRWDLGRGEAAVLAWAHSHPGTLAILDDAQARRCADSLQVPLIGTLGIVLRARFAGLIPAARPVLKQLVAQGMYLSEVVIEKALALAEE